MTMKSVENDSPENASPPKNGPNPDEYRRRLRAVRRETTRTVRNTLLAIAILAAIWWGVLYLKGRMNPEEPLEGTLTPTVVVPAPSETTSTKDTVSNSGNNNDKGNANP